MSVSADQKGGVYPRISRTMLFLSIGWSWYFDRWVWEHASNRSAVTMLCWMHISPVLLAEEVRLAPRRRMETRREVETDEEASGAFDLDPSFYACSVSSPADYMDLAIQTKGDVMLAGRSSRSKV